MSDTTPVSMFDETRRAEIQSQIEGAAPKRPDLSGLTHAELRKLKADIDRLLPESETLSDMDMPRELVAQFKRVKDLQDSVIDDDETPATRKPRSRARLRPRCSSWLRCRPISTPRSGSAILRT